MSDNQQNKNNDTKTFTMDDIKNLRKNLYGIMPWGAHKEMFNEMFDEWIENPNCKPKYPK